MGDRSIPGRGPRVFADEGTRIAVFESGDLENARYGLCGRGWEVYADYQSPDRVMIIMHVGKMRTFGGQKMFRAEQETTKEVKDESRE